MHTTRDSVATILLMVGIVTVILMSSGCSRQGRMSAEGESRRGFQSRLRVELRCVPHAEMSFTSPEDKPLVRAGESEQEQQQTRESARYQSPHTGETLQAATHDVLQGIAADPSKITISVVGNNRLLVETQPANPQEAERQKDAVATYLRETYPGIEIQAEQMRAVFVGDNTADEVVSILKRRLRSLRVRKSVVQKQGHDRVMVELPSLKDPERMLSILGSTAMLEFPLVPTRYRPTSPEPNTNEEWKDEQTGETVGWEQVRAESRVAFTGYDLMENAKVQSGEAGDWVVAFELKPDRKDNFREFTRCNVGRTLAIVLDRRCIMAPVIRTAIPGRGIIEGNMTAEEAHDLQILLNAGALPVPLEILEEGTYGPA